MNTDLMTRLLMLSAVLVVPMEVAKIPLGRLLRREPGPWELRLFAVVLGTALALIPTVLPAGVDLGERGLGGALAGAFCTLAYAMIGRRIKDGVVAVKGDGDAGK